MYKSTYIYAILLIMALTSCGQKAKTAADKVSDKDVEALFVGDNTANRFRTTDLREKEDQMTDFVRDVYKEVLAAYNEERFDRNVWINKYCTDAYKQICGVCDSICAMTGEIVGVDFDEWIWAQDISGTVTMRIVAFEMVRENAGVTEIEIHNGPSVTRHILSVVYNDKMQKWEIADFLSENEDGSRYSCYRDMKEQAYLYSINDNQ
ncbi:MAG: hypothetical protein K6E54_03260 [Bacteroidaceae bacterium]|nr:hypothetical protein [Bacteroidaceae bacterium]